MHVILEDLTKGNITERDAHADKEAHLKNEERVAEDIEVTFSHITRRHFFPINGNWQRDRCLLFNLSVIRTMDKAQAVPLGKPAKVQEIGKGWKLLLSSSILYSQRRPVRIQLCA